MQAPPSQDKYHCQPEDSHGAEWSGDPQDTLGSLDQQSLDALAQTFQVYNSMSKDMASSLDDLSVECMSADWEPNVSSLGSGSHAEWEQDKEEGEREGDGEEGEDDHSNSYIRPAQLSAAAPQPFHPAIAPGSSILILGTLPASSSFANLCPPPIQQGQWPQFSHQGTQVQTVQ